MCNITPLYSRLMFYKIITFCAGRIEVKCGPIHLRYIFIILVNDPSTSDEEQTPKKKKAPSPQKLPDPVPTTLPSPVAAPSLPSIPEVSLTVNYSRPKKPIIPIEPQIEKIPEPRTPTRRTTRITKPPTAEPKRWEYEVQSPPLPPVLIPVQYKPQRFPLFPVIALILGVLIAIYGGIFQSSFTLQFVFILLSLTSAIVFFKKYTKGKPTQEPLQELKNKKIELKKYLNEVDKEMKKMQETMEMCADVQKRRMYRSSIANYKNMIQNTTALYEEVEHKIVELEDAMIMKYVNSQTVVE